MINNRLKFTQRLKKPETIRIVVFVLLIVFIISIGYLVYLKSENAISTDTSVYDMFKSILTGTDSSKNVKIGDINYDSNGINVFGVNETAIIRCSNSEMSIYDKSGHEIKKVDISMNSPMIRTSAKMTVVADIGGKDIIMIKENKTLWTKKIDKNITGFDLNKDGYSAYITESKEYKSELLLLDPKGIPMFTRGKGEKFITDVKVSDSSDCVVANIVDATAVSANTNIEFVGMSVNLSKIFSQIVKEDFLASSIWYTDSKKLILLGKNEIYCFDGNSSDVSNEKWKVKLLGKAQSSGILKNKYFVVSSVANTSNMAGSSESQVKVIDFDGKEYSSYKLKGNVKNIKIYENLIMAYTGNDIYINTYKGTPVWKYSLSKDIEDVYFLYKDRIVIVGRDKAEILKIKG